jgi:hypothetical protein
MAFTQFTNLDFDQIKVSIKDYLRSNSTFTDFDFEGSNFSILIDVLAYNTYLTAYNTNMVANEAFLDSATLRENVVSLVRNIGFVPQSRKAAKANISFIVSGINSAIRSVTLKSGIVCTGSLDNTTYIFSIPDDITVSVSNGEAIFSNIDVYEGTYLTKVFTVDTSQPNQKYIIPNPFVDTSTIRVKVYNDSQDATYDEYSPIENIIGINSESQIFLIQEVSDEKYELFFGDGIFGKKLSNNNQIQVSYITTNGTGGNGASNFIFSGVLRDDNDAIITQNISSIITNIASENGDNIQSIESVRYYAPRLYASQRRAVTAGDYEALLPSLYSNIESVTAYGGEELSPPQYGKVFLAVKPKNSDYLSQSTKEFLLNDLKKYTIAGIKPEFIDINVLYVELDSTVYYNTNLSSSPNILKNDVISSLTSYSNSPDLNKFGGRFKYSKCLRIIDSTSSSITSNITKVKIRRNVQVSLNDAAQYLICFENRFSVRDNRNNNQPNIRSTGFSIKGNTSTLYIGDIVNDSTLKTGTLYLFSYENNKIVEQVNNIGTVNYEEGIINIDNINVSSTLKSNNIIEIDAIPYSNDIIAKKSIYLKLDIDSSNISVVKDLISSGENASGSRFTPESSYFSDSNIRS